MASIQGIYIALFGRPADPAGLEFWNDRTDNGADLAPLLGTLAREAEYLKRFDGMDDEQVIHSIYQTLFGRSADADGLSFFLAALESGEHTIETIAINILDGARGSDLDTLNAKIAAADLFVDRLDLPKEVEAYSGYDAGQIGRDYLELVDGESPADAALADEWILKLFDDPDEGQGPGGGPHPQPEPEPEPEPEPAFATFVNDDGKLEFKGTATGDIDVSVVDGKLTFTRDGNTVELEGRQDFSGLADAGLPLNSPDGESTVLAYDGTEWKYMSADVPLADYLQAVKGGHSTVLLSAGYDGACDVDAMLSFWGKTEADMENIGGDLLTGALEYIQLDATATNDLSIVASAGAQTTLMPLMDAFGLAAHGADMWSILKDVFVEMLPLGLNATIADAAGTISADGLPGFSLYGRLGENDILIGGRGDDYIVSAGGDGILTYGMQQGAPVIGLPEVGQGGDWVTGGVGADIFGYYGEDSGLLFITDFSGAQGDKLHLNIGGDYHIFNAAGQHDGADFTFIAFSGGPDEVFDLNAGIVLIGVPMITEDSISTGLVP